MRFVYSDLKTIKGDLIPYLVQQQFTDKKSSVASDDDTDWGSLMFVYHVSDFNVAGWVTENAVEELAVFG